MKLAISATTARTNFAPILLQGPLDEDFQKASEFGYDAIELHLRDPHDIDWDKTVELSNKYSLPISAIGTGAGARVDSLTFTHVKAEVRKCAIERIKEHLQLAKCLGCDIILGSMNGNIEGDEERKKYHLDCLRECCEEATKLSVTILLEPLNRYESDWLNKAQDALSVIDRLNCPMLKYLADTFHMNIEETSIPGTLEKACSNLGYVHLVDSNRCVPGYGHIPFHEIINTLKKMSYNGILSFECLPLPEIDIASQRAISFIGPLICA